MCRRILKGLKGLRGETKMLVQIVMKMIPVISELVKALKDKKLSADEAEALALHAGVVVSKIILEVAKEHEAK